MPILISIISFIFLISCSSDGVKSPNNNNEVLNQNQRAALENFSVFEDTMSEKLFPAPEEQGIDDRRKRIMEALIPCEVVWQNDGAKLTGDDCPIELTYKSEYSNNTISSEKNFLSKSDRISGLLGITESRLIKENSYTENGNDSLSLTDDLAFTATLLNQDKVVIYLYSKAQQQGLNIYAEAKLILSLSSEPNNALSMQMILKGKIVGEEIKIDEIQCFLNNQPYSCEKLEEVLEGFNRNDTVIKSAMSLQNSKK